jgi:hypothetical protein
MTKRRAAVPPGQGPGTNLQREGDGTAPKLPHEHDQSVGMTGNAPIPQVTRQGYKDVARGVKDTTRGDEADRAYQRQK